MEIVGVTICRPFGEFRRANSYFHLYCAQPTAGVLLVPCHDEFRGSRSDYVRQVVKYSTPPREMAAVVEWYRYRIVAGFVTSSSPVPLKNRRVGQRYTLNLSRAETPSRWCGVVARREGVPAQVSSTSLDHGSK
ncbi:uncharacterized protein TNCV_4805201 [Trichonephila clavipes]|nr:uncharacterized protein TNCV_4805201 [Trichonephila clavipes]